MSDAVTGLLLERLDADLRRRIRARQDGMLRELRYLDDRRVSRLLLASRAEPAGKTTLAE